MSQNTQAAHASPNNITIGSRNLGLANASLPTPSASPKFAAQTASTNNSGLVTLPDELLCQIAGYLAPFECVSKNEGYGLKHKTTDENAHETARSRRDYASRIQDLLQFGLTCSRFTGILRDILYRDVSILQPYRPLLPDERPVPPLRCFLRTMIEHPELAALVGKLSVWIRKGNPNCSSMDSIHKNCCACGTCMKKLEGLVDNLKLSLTEKEGGWLKDLSNPSDAVMCGLIFTALPNLHTLELYAKPRAKEKVEETLPYRPQSLVLRTNFKKGTGELLYQLDVLRLSQGLAMTHITSLRLSSNLNGLHTARLPSLKTLEVDYAGSNQFVTVGKGCFANVETLKIQCDLYEFLSASVTRPDRRAQEVMFSQKLNILLKGLPSVRTLEFQSGLVAACCIIPAYIETVKFRMADWDAVEWICDRFDDMSSGTTARTKLNLIEVHWHETSVDWSVEVNCPHFDRWQRLFRDHSLPGLKDFDRVEEKYGIRVVIIV